MVADVDTEVLRVSKLYPNHIRCRSGCFDCCKSFSVFPIEAEIIRAALSQGVGCNVGFDNVGIDIGCSLLADTLCSIYDSRPLICRTQGMPIGYVDHEQGVIEVSACELNFIGLEFNTQQLFMMDPFNERLQKINAYYCKLLKIDPWQRISIREITIEFEASDVQI